MKLIWLISGAMLATTASAQAQSTASTSIDRPDKAAARNNARHQNIRSIASRLQSTHPSSFARAGGRHGR